MQLLVRYQFWKYSLDLCKGFDITHRKIILTKWFRSFIDKCGQLSEKKMRKKGNTATVRFELYMNNLTESLEDFVGLIKYADVISVLIRESNPGEYL